MATRIIPTTWLIAIAVLVAGAVMPGIALGQECAQTAAEVRAAALQAGRDIEVGYPKYGADAFDEVLVIDHGMIQMPGYPPMPLTEIVHIQDDCVLSAVRVPRPAAEFRRFLHEQQQEA